MRSIVAYTIALLASLIKTQAPKRALDLRSIWAKQTVSSNLDNQLTLIAKAAFDVIVSPSQGFQNVTEWCKKEICWQRVRESDVQLNRTFIRELIGGDEVQVVKKDARTQQQINSGIEAQTTVVTLGAAYWSRLGEWGRQNKLLSANDEKLLKVASRIPKAIPTDWQSVALLSILQRMEEEGFHTE
ncbi:MAG: AIPR family protein [Acidobacteriota bacterium]